MFRENVTMETVTLNRKEQNRLMVLNEVNGGKIKVKQAAYLMELSVRHTKRLLAEYRKKGAGALSHGNRRRKPYNAVSDRIRQQIVNLSSSKYMGFNQQHFTEKLAECEGIELSRSSVRRILLGSGIRSPLKRRPPKHRSRRERYPREGMLLQIDGSPHDWLEGRGPKFSLIGAIDDATSKVPYAFFQAEEDSQGYMLMLQAIVKSQGIPLALYHDQDAIFEISEDKLPSIEEQLAGKKPLTQFGRLLQELGINSISANSPQAKGRVERLWRTFQDRLISELRLAGARTMEEANLILAWFLPQYNQKFAVTAADREIAYRKPEKGFKAEQYFCFKYPRTVGADNVVRFGSARLQILANGNRLSYAQCKVEIHQRLDDSLAIFYQGTYLPAQPAPVEATALRKVKIDPPETKTRLQSVKPVRTNPWRQWVYR
jgi:transposase